MNRFRLLDKRDVPTVRPSLQRERSKNETPTLAQAAAPEALMGAWRKVRANGGMPGVDGETLRDFGARLDENIAGLSRALNSGAYQPPPVRRIWRVKSDGGLRPIGVLTVRDRIAQRALHDLLAPIYERHFLPCSVGYREGLGVADAVKRIAAGRDRGLRWVVDGDIDDCFDRLDHRLLLDLLHRQIKDGGLLALIQRWLTAEIMNDLSPSTHRKPSMGAAQGGALSPLLCNVYLHEFDQTLTRAGLWLTRYADDWLIQCRSEAQARQAWAMAASTLGQIALRLNRHKSNVTHFERGFCFCGVFFVRGEHFVLAPGAKSPSPPERQSKDGRGSG